MTRSINDRRSPRNMCSVRHRPMPWAPSDLARAASSAVSAFARIASRRRTSAWVSSRSTALTSAVVSSSAPSRAAVQAGLDVGLHRRRHDGHRAEEDLAGRPVDADLDRPRRSAPCRPARSGSTASTSSASAPQTQVLPMPRATTAACEVFPPRAVRMPLAAIMPSRSSGLVSLRTSTTCSPRSAHALAVGESNTDPADRRARRGGHALGQQRRGRRTGRTAGTSAAPVANRTPGTAPRPW